MERRQRELEREEEERDAREKLEVHCDSRLSCLNITDLVAGGEEAKGIRT